MSKLSSEIIKNINKIDALIEKHQDVSGKLNEKLQNMIDELIVAQSKELEKQSKKYEDVKLALDEARETTEKAIAGLSSIEEVINKFSHAIKKIKKLTSVT